MTAVAAPLCYLFGILAAEDALPDVDPAPFADLRVIRGDGMTALVATPPSDRPLGKAADLVAHERVLGAALETGATVLPARFGSVLADDDAVAGEVLGPNRDRFRRGLDRLHGRVQYAVTARYDQDTVLREIVAEDSQIAALRASVTDDSPLAERMRLGELVVAALTARRPADAAALRAALEPYAAEMHVREPSAPEQVLQAACLVRRERCAEFEDAVENLGRAHHDRIRLRLVGPVPAYDFVEDS